MRSPIDPGQRRRRRADVSPISGKVMLRPAGWSPKPTKEANAATEARLAAILEALPIEPAEKEGSGAEKTAPVPSGAGSRDGSR